MKQLAFSVPAAFLAFLGASAPCAAQAKLWVHPKCSPLPTDKMGPFARLDDGSVLAIDGSAAVVSRDGGRTWSEPRPLFPNGPKLRVSNERALLRTRDGTLVLVFMDLSDRAWKWDDQKNAPAVECKLHVWAARSLDGGETWVDVQRIQEGYCGAVRDLVETRDGNIVATVQRLLPDKARHASMPYVSTDKGKTWRETTLLDIGGRGHHDGSIEATAEELKDGRLWMLLRTNHDRFWEAFSHDGGRTWRDFRESAIDASSAPGMLKRLESGRLVLLWNRLYPEGKTSVARRGLPWNERPASYHREELSIAFSEDDGKTWTDPVVIARKPGTWLAYPYVFEHRPGELWVTTMQGGLRLRLYEKDFASRE